jgi:hypothetical protein
MAPEQAEEEAVATDSREAASEEIVIQMTGRSAERMTKHRDSRMTAEVVAVEDVAAEEMEEMTRVRKTETRNASSRKRCKCNSMI